ncbi:hypothetical protein J1614_006118, partial [Plenodomus biglobosus]
MHTERRPPSGQNECHPPTHLDPSARCVSRGGALWADASLSCARDSQHRGRACRCRPDVGNQSRQQEASCPQADRLSFLLLLLLLLHAKRRQCKLLDSLSMICYCVHIIVSQPAGTLVLRFRLASHVGLASTTKPGCPRAVKLLLLFFFLCNPSLPVVRGQASATSEFANGKGRNFPPPVAFAAWCASSAALVVVLHRQLEHAAQQQGYRPSIDLPLDSNAHTSPLHMPSWASDTTHATCHHFRWLAGDAQLPCPNEARRMPSGPAAQRHFLWRSEVARRTQSCWQTVFRMRSAVPQTNRGVFVVLDRQLNGCASR